MEEFWKTADEDIVDYVKKQEKHTLVVRSIIWIILISILALIAIITTDNNYDYELESECEDVKNWEEYDPLIYQKANSLAVEEMMSDYDGTNEYKVEAVKKMNNKIERKYNIIFGVEIGICILLFIIIEIVFYIKYKRVAKPVEMLAASAKCIGKEKTLIWEYWSMLRMHYVNLQLPNHNVLEKYYVSANIYENVEFGHNLLIVKSIDSDREIDRVYIHPSKFKY